VSVRAQTTAHKICDERNDPDVDTANKWDEKAEMGRRRVQQMGPIGTSTRALAAQRTIAADKAHTRGRRRLEMRDGRRTRCRWRPICATTADAGRNERARRTSTTSASEPWARRNPKMDTWESDSHSEAQGQLLGFAVIFCHMSGIILQYHTNSTNSRSSSQQQSISRPTAPAASSKAERSPAVVILTGHKPHANHRHPLGTGSPCYE